ncbi:MAG: hypothetical protein NVV73_07730 [Cellvibrionaceae bacterium]|nr:hypothetical protein [Cellvibrionaceae bacterium]
MRFALLLLCLSGASALAHTPVCRCELNGQKIDCRGGFDDGSNAGGTTMRVISYSGDTLASGALDKNSRFSTKLPSETFYILMDVGPGEMFEVDWRDIDGLNPAMLNHPDGDK